jgi:glucose uptake protein GlcU
MSTITGFLLAGVSIVCFGSNFVVTKKYKSGDGLFFQFVMATAIFFAGMINYIVQCAQQGACPKFEPVAMLGGAIWCLGNVWVVPIVKTIGLSMGLLIWGMANMLIGWASGRFGLFGLTPNTIGKPLLNDLGVIIACLALSVYFFVKPEKMGASAGGAKGAGSGGDEDEEHDAAYAGIYKENELSKPLALNSDGGSAVAVGGAEGAAGADADAELPMWTDRLSESQKNVFGVVMSVVSGLLYGCNFNPPQYVVDHPDAFPGASKDLADYVFPHFCGIFITSLVVLQLYAAASKNKPQLYPEIVLPGFISGLMWATAQICWFSANRILGFAVAFPLISIGPGLVGALWGVFAFGEIKGTRNFLLLGGAFTLTTGAAICIALSQ